MAKAPAKGTKKKTFKKKEKRVVHVGVVHIQATFNNTIVTIADPEGNTVSWSSAGSLGFRGSRKGTPFAAQQAALTAANKANEVGLRTVEVRVSGPGSGRESAVRALATAGLDVRSIRDTTADSAQRLPPPEKTQSVVAQMQKSVVVLFLKYVEAGRRPPCRKPHVNKRGEIFGTL